MTRVCCVDKLFVNMAARRDLELLREQVMLRLKTGLVKDVTACGCNDANLVTLLVAVTLLLCGLLLRHPYDQIIHLQVGTCNKQRLRMFGVSFGVDKCYISLGNIYNMR